MQGSVQLGENAIAPIRARDTTEFTRRRRIVSQTRERDWQMIAVGVLSLIAGVVVLLWSYAHNYVLAYNDAQSHLKIARRVIDNRTPGFVQLGTVWLPVPHVMMLPFIWINTLWHTGLAGSFVGLFCLVITAVALFATMKLLTGRALIGWAAVIVLLTNPSWMYIQTTALTEPVLLMSMTAASYFLIRWVKDGAERATTLFVAGSLAALAVGSRYDGWVFAIACAVLVAITVAIRTHNAQRMEGYTLAYAVVPLYAMGLWLLYNWIYFGDPLSFQRSAFSAAFAQIDFEAKGLLPTKGNLIMSLSVYNWDLLDVNGWVMTVLTVVGILVYLAVTRFKYDSIVTYSFLSTYVFNVAALYLAQSIVYVEQVEPIQVFNVRYALPLLPGTAVFVAYLFHRISLRLGNLIGITLFALVLVLQGAQWVPGWPETSVKVLQEGLGNQRGSLSVRQVANYLNKNYDGGGLLVDDSKSTVLTIANINIREYIATFSGKLWFQCLIDPTPYARYVIYNKPQGDTILSQNNDIITERVKSNPNFFENYTPVFNTDFITVYKRTSDI